jgi:DNA modification methylase
MSKDQLIAELKRYDQEAKTTIIYEDKPKKSDEHPTMKPVRLFERLMLNSSKAEDIVLEPFGGSGTTIITAAKTGRYARVMELDPHYADVIRKRWTTWAKENGVEPGPGALE